MWRGAAMWRVTTSRPLLIQSPTVRALYCFAPSPASLQTRSSLRRSRRGAVRYVPVARLPPDADGIAYATRYPRSTLPTQVVQERVIAQLRDGLPLAKAIEAAGVDFGLVQRLLSTDERFRRVVDQLKRGQR